MEDSLLSYIDLSLQKFKDTNFYRQKSAVDHYLSHNDLYALDPPTSNKHKEEQFMDHFNHSTVK